MVINDLFCSIFYQITENTTTVNNTVDITEEASEI